MSKQTIIEEINKEADYHRLTFIEFLEFTVRLLYTRFVYEQEQSKIPEAKEEKEGEPNVKIFDNPMKRHELTDEQSRNVHLNIFKEFMCRRLEDFFESKGENFIDPDEEREVDESELSDFVYDLGEGFDEEEAKE